jgi:hypothetical protein
LGKTSFKSSSRFLRHNHVQFEAREFDCELGKAVHPSVGIPSLDGYVLAFHVAQFAQTLLKR